MADNKTRYTVRLDDHFLKKAHVVAKSQKRSLNQHIEFLLEQNITEYEKENGTINLPNEE